MILLPILFLALSALYAGCPDEGAKEPHVILRRAVKLLVATIFFWCVLVAVPVIPTAVRFLRESPRVPWSMWAGTVYAGVGGALFAFFMIWILVRETKDFLQLRKSSPPPKE